MVEVERFEDVVRHPRYCDSMVRHTSVGSLGIGMNRMRIAPKAIDHLSVGYSALAFYRSPTRIGLEVMGRERPVRDYLPGEIVVRPRGLDYATQYHRPTDVSVLALNTPTVRGIIGQPEADFEDRLFGLGVRPFWSPLLSELVRKLEQQTFKGGELSPLFADTLLQNICLELWHLTQGERGAENATGPNLSASTVRRINEFIDETAPGKIDLGKLATLAGLPTSHVAAAFKTTLGKSPYQYVLDRRIARARHMIETTRLSLAEISYRTGFSSQSHMTDVFRVKIGATPGALREQDN